MELKSIEVSAQCTTNRVEGVTCAVGEHEYADSDRYEDEQNG